MKYVSGIQKNIVLKNVNFELILSYTIKQRVIICQNNDNK